jgi:hypothetical protein
MPSHAHLETDLICPHCTTVFRDILHFFWGLCRGASPKPGRIYRIGDAIRWRLCKSNSTVLPWAVFYETGEMNVGDPTYRNLMARNVRGDYGLGEIICPKCKQIVESVFIEIRDGVIVSAANYPPILFAPSIDIYLIENDESLTPKHEWYDHKAKLLFNDC